MRIELRKGGFAYERGPHGFTIHWGKGDRVRGPHPRPLAQPDPGQASEVEVRFTEAPGGSTNVTLEHRGWERHGEGAQEYRDGFESAGSGRWHLSASPPPA